ncbi:hypothetical protein F5I97DRAFT_2014454 [Phlebopus sp. FC_14]|nr:hypothetical protein F5I97DRAFT_2014454 [Phlebopus sp. FC_14]
MSEFEVSCMQHSPALAYVTNVGPAGVISYQPTPVFNPTAAGTTTSSGNPVRSSATPFALKLSLPHANLSQTATSLSLTMSQNPILDSLIPSATRHIDSPCRHVPYRRSIYRSALGRATNGLVGGTLLAQTTTTPQESIASSTLESLTGPQTAAMASLTPIIATNNQYTSPRCNSVAHALTSSESADTATLSSLPSAFSNAGLYPDNRLPVILGPILGILALLALRVIFSKCRAYRRRLQKCKSASRSSRPQHSMEHKDCNPVGPASPTNTLSRARIIIRRSWSPTSAYTKENKEATRSHVGELSLNGNGQSCGIFADSADKRSSHTSVALETTEAVSTETAFVSVMSGSMDSNINMKDLESGSNINDGTKLYFDSVIEGV